MSIDQDREKNTSSELDYFQLRIINLVGLDLLKKLIPPLALCLYDARYHHGQALQPSFVYVLILEPEARHSTWANKPCFCSNGSQLGSARPFQGWCDHMKLPCGLALGGLKRLRTNVLWKCWTFSNVFITHALPLWHVWPIFKISKVLKIRP